MNIKTSTIALKLLNLYRQEHVIIGGWAAVNPIFVNEANDDVIKELRDMPTGKALVQHIENLRNGKTPMDSIDPELLPYGGMMTALILFRASDKFHYGIAGAGVYDWLLYDTHYTERFMDTPEFNAEGYRKASVLSYIPEIFSEDYQGQKPKPGALKITHGTGDDNVHFQNTLILIDALQKAGYQFELMIYPDGMHGYRGAQSAHDKASDQIFWTKHLLGD